MMAQHAQQHRWARNRRFTGLARPSLICDLFETWTELYGVVHCVGCNTACCWETGRCTGNV